MQVVVAQNDTSGATPYISHRDNKLTYLLKGSLGGNSKAVLIANVSQNIAHEQETICTLKFALEARAMVNHATVNMKAVADSLQALKDEVSSLHAQLIVKVSGFHCWWGSVNNCWVAALKIR